MSNDMSNKKKIIIPAILLLVIAAVGVSYAFFNYTRTGPANTLNTGRIYFSTEQTNNNTINLNNIFPMTKEQALADSSTNGTLVVTFNGDTEYTDGMEYLLSIDSVTGTANVPISLIMDVNITENNVALTENPNYYTARETKTTSMYKAEGENVTINSTSHKVITDVKTGKYLLAGYIKSGEYGVNGTITIKAFIDADNILITDTPDDQSQRPSTAYTDGTDTTGKTVISTDDWNALQSSGISFKVKGEAREGIWVKEQLSRNDLKDFNSSLTTEQKTSVTEINFIKMSEEEINTHANLIDLTADGGEGIVKGWIDNNILYIASPGETYLSHVSQLFAGFSNVTNINFNNINTSDTTNMSYWFINCSNLISLDLSSFDTSNVIDMNFMFEGCSSLSSLDLSSFDTSNVTSMQDTFKDCSNLSSINLSSFDTSKVTNMQYLFSGCSNLVTLDLSSFNTSLIATQFSYFMFNNCTNLTTIYVSNTWDISGSYTNMPIFTGCTSLVGGNGTTFDSSKTDKTMAVIDTPSTPGYLTLKQS